MKVATVSILHSAIIFLFKSELCVPYMSQFIHSFDTVFSFYHAELCRATKVSTAAAVLEARLAVIICDRISGVLDCAVALSGGRSRALGANFHTSHHLKPIVSSITRT